MSYVTIFDKVPLQITAGDSVSWKISLSDFPASDSWVLTYSLVKSDTKIEITSQADGDDHLVEISFATSAGYTVGEYEWQARISNGTERYQVDSGVVEIVADFASQSTGYDARSHAKIVLDALEAAIEGRASKTQMSQMVGKIQVQHMTLEEQVNLRDRYKAKVRKELVNAGKIKSRRIIKTRFI